MSIQQSLQGLTQSAMVAGATAGERATAKEKKGYKNLRDDLYGKTLVSAKANDPKMYLNLLDRQDEALKLVNEHVDAMWQQRGAMKSQYNKLKAMINPTGKDAQIRNQGLAQKEYNKNKLVEELAKIGSESKAEAKAREGREADFEAVKRETGRGNMRRIVDPIDGGSRHGQK